MDLIDRNWLLQTEATIGECMGGVARREYNSNQALMVALRKQLVCDYLSVTSKTLITVGRNLFRATFVASYSDEKRKYIVRLLDCSYMGGITLTEDEQKRIVRLLMAWIERQLATDAK